MVSPPASPSHPVTRGDRLVEAMNGNDPRLAVQAAMALLDRALPYPPSWSEGLCPR
jgi:hypothetical protein